MTILLLGGNGLLGHNVLNLLLLRGYKVHALVRHRESLHWVSFPHVDEALTILEGSPLDQSALEHAATGCDAIINCAGITDMGLLKYEDYLPVNRNLCSLLVRLMEHRGITRLVHTSTANTIGYGTPTHPADESAPMQSPFVESYYARSKREGEALLLEACAKHPDWHLVVVNPGFMVGGYDYKPSSGQLLMAAWRKPLMMVPQGGKSFIHVADAATAIVNALTMGQHGARYLLTGENRSLMDFYRIQRQCCGYRQLLLPCPNWLLALGGKLGDLLHRLGIRTQACTRNVRQLMVYEYYDNRAARTDLAMPQRPVTEAIADFFANK